ncbi:MAG: hypothetical protein U5Q03_11385 [Bacteroidota bacterium]|nr:hypothetical protein [Bacteroidota bacterium]
MKIKKKLSGLIILLIIAGLTLELSPFILAPAVLGHSFSRKEYRKDLKDNWIAIHAEKGPGSKADNYKQGIHSIHPYLGFVHNPGGAYNDLGFLGPDPLDSAKDNTLNICLCGGSVAKLLFQLKGDYFAEKLRESDVFSGQEIRLFSVALGGFKQPQQMLSVNYLLSLGAHFDLIVNLDGFNEVVLPYTDNMSFDINPSYPRNWDVLSRKSLDTEEQILLGEQAMARHEKDQLTVLFVESPLKYSNLAMLFWKVLDNNKINKINSTERELDKLISEQSLDYQSTGPACAFADTNDYFRHEVKLWAEASALLYELSRSGKFNYFHFLQPNQYVPASKRLTKKELEIAYIEGASDYKTAVKIGYPMLQKKGMELIREGIAFKDLSMMFREVSETVYNDKCCHFNEHGYEMIADEMVSFIENYYTVNNLQKN